MEEQIKMICPTYLREFKCIGGRCEDNCCCGWAIHIDKITFQQYKNLSDPKMNKRINKNIFIKKKCNNPNIDYAQIKLKRNKRCPFLEKDNYCVIHSKLGEQYLSNVCTMFPRVLNKIDDCYEMSLDVSCMEAARILLIKEEGIEFIESKDSLGKHVLTMDIDINDEEFHDTNYKYIKEIRDTSIRIIKNRKYELSERLYMLGCFLENTCKKLSYNRDKDKLAEFINTYNIDSFSGEFKRDKTNYMLQISFYRIMLDKLKVCGDSNSNSLKSSIKEVIFGGSDYFKSSIKRVIAGFRLNEDKSLIENSEVFTKAYDICEEGIFEKYSYIFENYLVNHMFKELFPFSENDEIMDGYIMLLVRFSYIRFYLVGQYLYNGEISKENIIRSIQVLIKEIEHDSTYLNEVLKYLKDNELDNQRFVNILL